MKKHILHTSAILLLSAFISLLNAAPANLLEGKTICIDPALGTNLLVGHPMPTIGVSAPTGANTPAGNVHYTGYIESAINLDVAERLRTKLEAVGATVVLTRTNNSVNPSTAERLATITASGAHYFVSIQASEHFDGSTHNYLYLSYRGDDAANKVDSEAHAAQALQEQAAEQAWRYLFESMGEGLEPYVGGYTYSVKKVGKQNMEIMEHNIPGYVSSNYFRTYQPARQRALNKDWRDQEATRLFRAITAYLVEKSQQTTGDIMGVVKSGDVLMTNSDVLSPTSFAYIAGSHDQYQPLNGATVILKQGGVEKARYTVDNNYNGIFVFKNLEPGTYQVEASYDNYHTQIQNVEVVENETTYPIYLLSQKAEVSNLTDIPNLKLRWEETYKELEGKVIRRSLCWDDNIVILAHDNDRKAYIYAIKHRDKTIHQISTKLSGGDEIVIDPTNPREYLAISDIAITDDNKLIACNFLTCYYGEGDGYVVDPGAKRGALKFYKWETITADPILWVSKSTGGIDARDNYHCVGRSEGADMGYTMTVSGPSNNCIITTTGVDHDYTMLRYAHINIVNDQIVGGTYTKSGLADPTVFLNTLGKDPLTGEIKPELQQDYRLNKSPLGPKRWIIDGTTISASEFIQTTCGAYNTINGKMAETAFGVKAIETDYVNYKAADGNHLLVVAPYYTQDAENEYIAGVHIYDITDHDFNNAVLVPTPTTTLATPIPVVAGQYASAVAMSEEDGQLCIFLQIGHKIIKYSTLTAEQEIQHTSDRDIFAYGLSAEDVRGDHAQYKLTFSTNTKPIDGDATLIFYQDGIEIHRETYAGVVTAAHTPATITVDVPALQATLAAKGITLNAGDELTWAVEVEAHRVHEWGLVRSVTGFTNAYHAVDKSPESPNMGRIYVVEGRKKATDDGSKDGVYVIEPNYQLHSNNLSGSTLKPILDGTTAWYMPRRPSVDSEGTLYVPERATSSNKTHSGVFIAESDSILSGNFKPLFAGTRTNGIFIYKNGSEDIYTGASSTATSIYGKGKDTKLITINTPLRGGTLAPNGLHVYNLGQIHGHILTSWNKVQSDAVDIGYSSIEESAGAMEVCLHATEHGVFVGTNRQTEQNDAASAIQFYDWDGNVLYKSVVNTEIHFARGGGFVVSSDEKILVMNNEKSNGTFEFLIYDVLWIGGKPSLSLRERTRHNHGVLYQMSFDYAGNLVVSGEKGLFVYATPSIAANKRRTPAREIFNIIIPENVNTITSNGRAIYAYDLKLTQETDVLGNLISGGDCTFSFKVNNNATAATLIFYEKGTTKELGRMPLPSPMPKVGATYTYTINEDLLPSPYDCPIAELSWGVEVTSHPVTESWQELYKETTQTYTNAYSTVDIHPESPYFGQIYVLDRKSGDNSAGGMHIYSVDWILQNTEPYTGGENYVRNPQRMSVDYTGRVYMSDYKTAHPGVYCFDPANPTNDFAQFLTGTLGSSLVKNGSTVVGAATTTTAIYGTGKNTKLLISAEVASGTTGTGSFDKNSILIYNIGNEDGTIKQTWGAVPSQVIENDTLTAYEGVANVVATEQGIWAAEARFVEGTSTPCVLFFDWSGTLKWTSAGKGLGIVTNLRTALAVSRDGKTVVVQSIANTTESTPHKLVVLDVTYAADGTPSVTKREEFTYITDLPTANYISQMNFDYAGNLVASGTYGMYIYSFKKENNTCVTPAVSTIKRTYVTEPTKQPVRGVFAYDLRVTGKTEEPEAGNTFIEPNIVTNAYEFSFMANESANKAEIIFYADATRTTELKRITIPTVTEGNNSITISAKDLPENRDNPIAWSIELTGDPVTEWGTLSYDKIVLGNQSTGAIGISAINNNPQSYNFGRIYTYYRKATDVAGNPLTGSYIYTPLENRISNPQQAGSPVAGANIARMSTDDAGNVYLSSKGPRVATDPMNPGVFIGTSGKTDRDVMTFRPFFSENTSIDATNSEFPIIKNTDGDEIGSAILGIDVTDMGNKGPTMIVYANGHSNASEGTIPYHSVLFYHLGNDWDPTNIAADAQSYGYTKGPDKILKFNNSNHHDKNIADVWSTSHGIFVCHLRSLGANNTWSASLLFVTNDQINSSEELVTIERAADFAYNSGLPENQFYINGSEGGAMAVSADEKTLVLQNAASQLLVFDITWTNHKPTLTLRAVYNTGVGSINQMDFDYGGNLITTGIEGMATFTIPDPNKPFNRTCTPAMNQFAVKRNAPEYDRIFTNAAGDHKWSNTANWKDGLLPSVELSVLIQAPCEVDERKAGAKYIDLQKGTIDDKTYNATLTILPTGALTVAETIRNVTGTAYNNRTATTTTDLVIQSNLKADGTLEQGILAHFDEKGETAATVKLQGKYPQSAGLWQYVGVPFEIVPAETFFDGSWMYKWSEPTSEYIRMRGYDHPLHVFNGYLLLQPEPKQYNLTGTLEKVTYRKVKLSATESQKKPDAEYDHYGANFLANSWTAPLRIAEFDVENDFYNTEATIYIYDPSSNNGKPAWDNGQLKGYATYPIKSASLMDDAVINPYQGFFVMATGADPYINFHPKKLIQMSLEEEQPDINPYLAPRRKVILGPDDDDEIPYTLMRIRVESNDNQHSSLLMLESEIYTHAFDNGWDGRKIGDDAGIPYLAAVANDGDMAVLATPQLDGTFLNFVQGTGTQYTFHFTYDDDACYTLEDAIAGDAVEIRTGNTYTFYPSTDDSNRFRIVQKQQSPDVTTQVANIWANGNTIYLSNPLGIRTTISIFSAEGKLIEAITTCESVAQFQVPTSGMYLIQLSSEQGVQTIKHIL